MSNLSGKDAIKILTGQIEQFNNVKKEIDTIHNNYAPPGLSNLVPAAIKKGVDMCIACLEEKIKQCKNLME